MEGPEGNTNNNEAGLSIEQARTECDQDHEYVLPSAHTVGHDSWQQVGLMLVTGFNCGYILSFSNLMLVPLGWTWGIIWLVVVGFYTAYANWLLAAFHFINGQRFIRYRDLMGYLFGRELFYITWVFQFLTLLLGNMGFILLGGRALKEINSELSDSPLRLQYFIVITGVTYFVFAFFIPTMSKMRFWLGPSTIVTFAYIVILLVVLVKDGKTKTTKRDYEIHGNKADRVFNAFNAISAIIVCNTSGLLPEIQSTLRKPAVTNMRKGLYLQYSAGLLFYYGVSIVGYWAYGATVSEYLPEELSGPKSVKVLINTAVFLQSIVSQHMFVAPIHEALDTKFLKLDESMHSKNNIKRRFYLRALLFMGNTFVTAAFPFMGDFVNLFGSFTLVPLTFVFPSMIFIKVIWLMYHVYTIKHFYAVTILRLEKNMWHWFNIVIFSLLAIVTTISAVRLIVNNVKEYNFFADT